MTFLRTAATTSLVFGAAVTACLAGFHGWRVGAQVGPLAGLAFGLAVAGFGEAQRRRLAITAEAVDGERLLRQGPANHWLGGEARGGWLVLTERSLRFRPHGTNLQRGAVRVPLVEITAARGVRTLGLVPNGLRVERAGGAERFVVADRGGWLAALAAAGVPSGGPVPRAVARRRRG